MSNIVHIWVVDRERAKIFDGQQGGRAGKATKCPNERGIALGNSLYRMKNRKLQRRYIYIYYIHPELKI